MPVYLDSHVHAVSNGDLAVRPDDRLKLGLKLVRIINVAVENRDYCIIDAPDQEAVVKFHLAEGVQYDWIEEVTTLNDDFRIC